VLTQERQTFSVINGYTLPPGIEELGLKEGYMSAITQAADVAQNISHFVSPEAAQYAIPFIFNVRWRIKLNFREVIHLVELRSQRQGHPAYREIAWKIADAVKHAHPLLGELLQFVDYEVYDLERLNAEQRIDRKLATQ
jgi:thymidylate synthase ThyX